ncbi:hypothetical protein ACIRQP_36920 [Streptomyces sp. NPDC102274]|uniref:hypothetical protein n=1 Tax=Streptomyces sp. NPDC102274 TaxID=3366151 RepID=UPI0037F239C8
MPSWATLSGRAQQAVVLSREDASPFQVAADTVLQQDPFVSEELFVGIDPTAAAFAAAHRLAAAGDVADEASGPEATQVILEADNIQALPHETPTCVLGLINDGATPHEAVTSLVRHAMHITDGRARNHFIPYVGTRWLFGYVQMVESPSTSQSGRPFPGPPGERHRPAAEHKKVG